MAPELLRFSAGLGKSWYPLVSFVTCCALPEPAPVACGLSPDRPGRVRLRRREIGLLSEAENLFGLLAPQVEDSCGEVHHMIYKWL
jgi:hypothetical protein